MIEPMLADATAFSTSLHDHGPARVARILALVGGLIVIALSLLVTTSILMRWLGGEGINGDFEMVQMGLALAIFAFLPLCQVHRGNVMVDTFTNRLPSGIRAVLDRVWDLVYAGFAGFIAWRLAIGAMETFSNHTTSMVLALPIHYAIGACAAMAAFLSLICCFTALRHARMPS